jgi:signal transduction histidine kinase
MGKRALAGAVLILLALAALGCLDQPANAGPFPLVGPIRSHMCEQLQCPMPSAPDASWESLRLGISGLDHPFPHRNGIGWVRLDFVLAAPERLREPALLISHPADAEEVWINGVPIGGGGIVGERYVTVPGPVRVLPIPDGVLAAGENVLMMKALFAERSVELFDGPFRIGERDRLAFEAERILAPAIGMEAAFLSLFGFTIAFYSFLIVRGVVRSDYLLFAAFMTVYMVTFFLDSNLAFALGIKDPSVERFNAVLGTATTLFVLPLVTIATGTPFGIPFYLLAAAAAGFVLAGIALPPMTALYALPEPRTVFLTLSGIYYLVISSLAVARRREDAGVIMVGVSAYVVGSRLEIFWGLQMRDYSMGVFTLCMLFAIVSRHARMQGRLVSLSGRLLDAHEEERSRIARDIHDGVGQSLQALRLRLQMLSAKSRGGDPMPAGTLDALATDTASIIEEVRRTSLDLRPSFIEGMTLREALSWYSRHFMERSRIPLDLRFDDGEIPDPPPRVKDNLYRALQEILSNARRHAGASRISVSLGRSGDMLVLAVSDDGSGISAGAPEGRKGIGLETIRERAELLGGSCKLDSKPGKGTTVTLEVPFK